MSDPADPRIAILLETWQRLESELAKIDAEHASKRAAAIARSGLSPELVASALGGSKSSPLPSSGIIRSISVDMQQSKSEPVKPLRDRRGRPLETDARFPRVLEAKGSNVDEWARTHRRNPKTVRSWYQRSGARRIPAAIAKEIEQEMGVDDDGNPLVPATLESWPNGIAQ